MKHLKYFFLLSLCTILPTNAYLFGFKSADNTIENIQNIEETHKITLPLVGFIFDPRSDQAEQTMNNLASTLGTGRIYHITLSPNTFSAQEVAS
jgi:cellulose biosynthesis protein BcsQ